MVELIAVKSKSKSIFIATIFDIVLGSFGSFLLYLIVTYRMSGPHGLKSVEKHSRDCNGGSVVRLVPTIPVWDLWGVSFA